jgi:RNA polymerase-associated protein LEO1
LFELTLRAGFFCDMSSSDEEDVVRRPARSGAGQALGSTESAPGSPVPAIDAGNMSGAEDDDADLFGSDGSEGGFDQDTEYAVM